MTKMTRKPGNQSFHTVEWTWDGDAYRVRRATWPNDAFSRLSRDEFWDLKAALSKPVVVDLFPTIFVELVDAENE